MVNFGKITHEAKTLPFKHPKSYRTDALNPLSGLSCTTQHDSDSGDGKTSNVTIYMKATKTEN